MSWFPGGGNMPTGRCSCQSLQAWDRRFSLPQLYLRSAFLMALVAHVQLQELECFVLFCFVCVSVLMAVVLYWLHVWALEMLHHINIWPHLLPRTGVHLWWIFSPVFQVLPLRCSIETGISFLFTLLCYNFPSVLWWSNLDTVKLIFKYLRFNYLSYVLSSNMWF